MICHLHVCSNWLTIFCFVARLISEVKQNRCYLALELSTDMQDRNPISWYVVIRSGEARLVIFALVSAAQVQIRIVLPLAKLYNTCMGLYVYFAHSRDKGKG